MLLIENAHIKTMVDDDIINGYIIVKDGKIADIGYGENYIGKINDDFETIDAQGKLLTPGLVEAHCHIGLDNECLRWEGNDFNEITDPVTPQLRAIDSIYPQDETFINAVKCGVTTGITGPGSANVVGGTFVAIKLYGDRVDDMIIKNPVAMKVAFGENPKMCYGQKQKSPQTRMAVAATLRELLFKTKRYMEDKEGEKTPAFDMKLEAMIPVLKGELPLKAHAHRADDILTAIRVANEFGVKITLDHCTDGAVIVKHLKAENKPIFIGPSMGSKTKPELKNKSFKTPKVFAENDIKFGIITDAPVIPLEYLSTCASWAVNAGLDTETAWKAITIWPAELIGINDRVGSLEVGKDADIVIWNNDPLTNTDNSALYTIIDEKIIHKQ